MGSISIDKNAYLYKQLKFSLTEVPVESTGVGDQRCITDCSLNITHCKPLLLGIKVAENHFESISRSSHTLRISLPY